MDGKLSRRGFLQWSALVGVSGALAACAQPAGSGTTTAQEGDAAPGATTAMVVWWNPDIAQWQPSYQGMADEFTRQNPEIGVDIQNVPEDGFLEKTAPIMFQPTMTSVFCT